MKKIYLLVSSLFITSLALAQTYEFVPVAGDLYDVRLPDSAGVTFGASGNGITWDYSTSLVYSQPDASLSYQAYTPGTFAGATLKLVDGTNETYYSKAAAGTSTVLSVNGVHLDSPIGQIDIPYSDPQKVIKYPFTYTDGSTAILTDTYAGSFDVNLGFPMTVNLAGTSETYVDGKGTLKLSSQNYQNVLRIHIISHGNLTSAAANGTLNQDIYQWYIADDPTDVKNPAFEIINTVIDMGTMGSQTTKTIHVNKNINTGIHLVNSNNLSFAVSPNPSTGNVNLKYSLKERADVSVTVFNTLGEAVYSSNKVNAQEGNYSEAIDLSSLAKGIYMVRLVAGNTINEQKIVVE